MKGDVVIAKSGTLGSVAVIDKEHEFSLFESLCLLKPIHKKINSIFLSYALRSKSIQRVLLGMNKGIGVKHLHLVDIRSLNIPLPTLQIQEQIVSKLLEIKKLQKKYLHQHKLLNEQLVSLSSDLLKGNT